ncbi:MAG: hypothetical protein AAF717_07440 [Bacteroidota bacterium]
MKEKFIGKWVLLPEQSTYEQGGPPQKATYSFEEGANGALHIAVEWIDEKDKENRVHYTLWPDGQKRKYENPEIADEVMSEFKGVNQLNSYTYKASKTKTFASRIIDENGKMEVIQRFFHPNGQSFETIQYYKKQ